MPKFNFHLGVTLRSYGNVEIEADSVEAALPLLTADFVGSNIDITETTTDSGQDLAVIDVTNVETGKELDEWDGHPLPSPYDPPEKTPAEIAAPDMLTRLRDMRAAYGRLHDFLSDAIEGGRLSVSHLPDDYAAICDALEKCGEADHFAGIAIAKAEGRANG